MAGSRSTIRRYGWAAPLIGAVRSINECASSDEVIVVSVRAGSSGADSAAAAAGMQARHEEGGAMTVHIAEAYLDYEKSCILGVYDSDNRARKRIHAINEDRERLGFNRYAISSWMTGETLPSQKRWFYPAGGTLIEQDDG